MDDQPDAPSDRGGVAPESRRAPTIGLVASLVAHALLLLLAAFILIERPGGAGRDGGEIELAIISQAELSELQDAALSSPSVEVEADLPDERVDLDAMEMPVADVSIAAPSLDSVGALDGAGESLSDNVELGGAGDSGASFFGVESRGARFAYIVDVSGSMSGPRIETLRRELAGSVDELVEHASFIVMFFSHETRVVGGRNRWTRATRRHKDIALREINAVAAGGATNPMGAFQIAFNLRPLPDAIYFMTDGVFSQAVVGEVARLNSRSVEPTPIHTISFVQRDAEELLRRIAQESGGSYTHIEGPGQ